MSKTWEKLQALWIGAIYEKSEILQQNKIGNFSWKRCGDNSQLYAKVAWFYYPATLANY